MTEWFPAKLPDALNRFESEHQCAIKLATLGREILTQVDEWLCLKRLGFEATAAAKAVTLAGTCQAAAANCIFYITIVEAEELVPGSLIPQFS